MPDTKEPHAFLALVSGLYDTDATVSNLARDLLRERDHGIGGKDDPVAFVTENATGLFVDLDTRRHGTDESQLS